MRNEPLSEFAPLPFSSVEDMSCGSGALSNREPSNRAAACHQHATVTAAFN